MERVRPSLHTLAIFPKRHCRVFFFGCKTFSIKFFSLSSTAKMSEGEKKRAKTQHKVDSHVCLGSVVVHNNFDPMNGSSHCWRWRGEIYIKMFKSLSLSPFVCSHSKWALEYGKSWVQLISSTWWNNRPKARYREEEKRLGLSQHSNIYKGMKNENLCKRTEVEWSFWSFCWDSHTGRDHLWKMKMLIGN